MKILNFVLLTAILAFASTTTIQVCNERACYEQKIEISRYEWQRSINGDKFLRVYKPDGTIVDITGRDLKIEFQKSKKEIRRSHK